MLVILSVVTDKEVIRSIVSLRNPVTNRSKHLNPYSNLAIWDTGATHCFISPELANFLKLQPTGNVELIQTPTNKFESTEFNINIYFVFDDGEPTPYENISVWTLPDLNQFDIIISMDIISRFDFSITSGKDELIVSLSPPQ